jgi:hypothetical protein
MKKNKILKICQGSPFSTTNHIIIASIMEVFIIDHTRLVPDKVSVLLHTDN